MHRPVFPSSGMHLNKRYKCSVKHRPVKSLKPSETTGLTYRLMEEVLQGPLFLKHLPVPTSVVRSSLFPHDPIMSGDQLQNEYSERI
ncbi:hypothetical protein AVEN_265605-1 [Araneus ventricosus]|uniref:Uncharacterized protein n=1 Tax=Araneus ventricosus TaxID=182803 RepID=A0A4Y2UFB8_ARAVE|nr:hypothetical protein AVEN_265605-1 [Araneus ventricosus]